jgi:tripartite-type tricarboxylate transporter receptor subunit TctC
MFQHFARSTIRLPLAVAIGLAATWPALAQKYPSQNIKLIVPFPPGGGADTLARILTKYMSDTLGQQFVIINQPGAGGAHAFAEVAKAAPDGYTLVWTSAAFPVMATTIKSLSFDPARDFTHVSQIGQNPLILVVNPGVKASSIADLVALAKVEPGKLTFANNGRGTLTNLVVELFKLRAGIDVAQVAYRGDNFSSNDVVAGHISGMFLNSTVAFPLLDSGKLRALAVTAPKRTPTAPQLLTMHEAGVPGFAAVVWQGLSAPPGTPRPVLDALVGAIRKGLDVPEVADRFQKLGADRVGGTPEEFDALIQSELKIWADVVKQAGVKVE